MRGNDNLLLVLVQQPDGTWSARALTGAQRFQRDFASRYEARGYLSKLEPRSILESESRREAEAQS